MWRSSPSTAHRVVPCSRRIVFHRQSQQRARPRRGSNSDRQEDRIPGRPGGNRAGRAWRAVEGRAGRGCAAHAGVDPGGRRPGIQSSRQGRHLPRRPDGAYRHGRRPRRTGTSGRVANPDFLRTKPEAVAFANAFFDQANLAGVICDGAWTLIEADVVRGRRLTSWPRLRTDLRNAGAQWVDQQVVTDHGLVSSRTPDGLPAPAVGPPACALARAPRCRDATSGSAGRSAGSLQVSRV